MKTPKIVIADASCLIVLSKIRKLELLRLVYSEINITLEVKTEYGENLPSWFLTKEVSDKKYQKFLEFILDKNKQPLDPTHPAKARKLLKNSIAGKIKRKVLP